MSIGDYVLIILSTETATRFQLREFKPNGIKPSDHLPEVFDLKKGQVTKCIKPIDFKPNDNNPSDYIPEKPPTTNLKDV